MRTVKGQFHLLTPLVACVALGLGTIACGSEGKSSGGGGTQDDRDAHRAAERARQVSDAWEGSEAARLWRTGHVPLGDPVRLPKDAFHSEADKRAYLSRNFDLRGTLSGAPPDKGEVRRREGGSLAVPVLSARATYEKFARGDEPGTRLTVTSARLGEMTLLTHRGPASVPAWHFTVEGYDTPLTHAAVNASSKLPRSPIGPVPNGSDGLSPLVGRDGVSEDGRGVTVRAGHGSCDDGPVVDALEGGDNVVLSASVRGHDEGPCTADLRLTKVTVKLTRPLGDRLLLDASTGRPVPYGGPGTPSPSRN